MNQKILIVVIIAFVIGGAGGFYGGMKYAQNKINGRGNMVLQDFQNMTQEERQQATQRFRDPGSRILTAPRGNGSGGGFVSGEILIKDDKSITMKLPDGSTKIVFYSDSTTIGKATTGTASDLALGEQAMVSGTVNSDGTIAASSIQLRPGLPVSD